MTVFVETLCFSQLIALFSKVYLGDRELAQQLRAWAAFPEDPSLVPKIYLGYSQTTHLQLQLQGSQCLL